MANNVEALRKDHEQLLAAAAELPGVHDALAVMKEIQEPLATSNRAAYATMFVSPVSVGNHTQMG